MSTLTSIAKDGIKDQPLYAEVANLILSRANNLAYITEMLETLKEAAEKEETNLYKSIICASGAAAAGKKALELASAGSRLACTNNMVEDNSIEIKFVVGKVYSTRSSCNHDCIYSYEILRRTDKSVWIKSEVGRGVIRRSVKVRAGVEYIYPEGRYSMAPVINADRPNI